MTQRPHCCTLRVLAVMAAAVAASVVAVDAHAVDTPRVALVVQDQVALRSAARDSAPATAQLWRGDAVELRGERGDHLQIWDHHRERGGYVRKAQLLAVPAGPGALAELLAQLRLTGQQPGNEALGIGLAAAAVQAATPAELSGPAGAEVLDTLGTLAERLADRASAQGSATAPAGRSGDAPLPAPLPAPLSAPLAAQLDVAARHGLRFQSLEAEEGRMQVCYDGDAFRRVLALGAAAELRARAALALTRPECGNRRATPKEVEALDRWRADVLAKVDAAGVPQPWKNRLLMRRASVAASLAFFAARRGQRGDVAAGAGADAAADVAAGALADFAALAPADLTDDDLPAYNDAAMRVNAARWLAQPAGVATLTGMAGHAAWALATEAAADGQTCVALRDTRQPAAAPLARRCTYGLVQLASTSANREANALALAVQPLDGWRELWVFTQAGNTWRIDVLPPAAAQPGLGFAEFAGWVPGGTQMLVARESRAEGRYRRSFELVSLANLATERQSADPKALGPFQRWADAAWLRNSPSQR